MKEAAFRVGLTRDLQRLEGGLILGPVDLSPLESDSVQWGFLPEHGQELAAPHVAGFDALFAFGPRITEATVSGSDRLTLVARHGVGLDTVDLAACTEHGVMVTTTPEGIRRPMALGVLAFLLALSHRLVEKDRAAREEGWPRRFETTGVGLSGRTLGIVGFGNIGRDVAALVAPLGMRLLAFGPRLLHAEAAAHGVKDVSLERLLAESDFVVVACPLTEETHHLLDGERLSLLRPTAQIVNVSRGAVVDEAALVQALREGRLAGAALDVFEEEPLPAEHPLLGLDNVILAPHAIGYTDELFRGCVDSIIESILAVARGQTPAHVANPAVLDSPLLVRKLQTHATRVS